MKQQTTIDYGADYEAVFGRGRAAVGALIGGHVEVRSEGSWIWTSSGQKFLDCGGYGVFTLGHRHPDVVSAVKAQLEEHPLGSRVFFEPNAAEAARLLVDVAPSGLEFVQFVNSGAEATEFAIKAARAAGRPNIICMSHGFHGKTTGALSLTSRSVFQKPFLPLLPGVRTVSFGDSVALEAALGASLDSSCAVIVEPVQGEGGVRIPDSSYLNQVRELCTRYGALLIMDEIQTGLGRLGSWWGHQLHSEASPDMMLVGKALSGGVVPIAAVLASAECFAPFAADPYLHTSTFAASPLACSAASAALRVSAELDIPGMCADRGAYLLGRITELLRTSRQGAWTVRGTGLLIGLESAEAGGSGDLFLKLLEKGVLSNHSLNASRVIRLTPSALITDEECDLLLEALTSAVEEVDASS